ncbi:MAG TPA: hypothetical protein ENN69_04485, partial [Spirochaetia bacterium]|nr:hypothetical protein [Spirochaetia bacterium]
MYFGKSGDALTQALSRADYSFLDEIDANRLPGNEIFSYAPGAGLFFGLAAHRHGAPELAEHFLRLEWERSEEPYAREAAEELLVSYNARELFEKTVPLAEACLTKYKDTPFADRAAFFKIEAVYWQKKDQETLDLIAKMFPVPRETLKVVHPELFLFLTVAETRLQKTGWEKTVREFYATLPASSLHWRFYTFLKLEKERLAPFSPQELALFEAKS